MILSKAVHIPQYVSRRSKVLKMKIILFLLAVFLSLNELPVLGLNCNPKSLIEHWEGRMPCVYLDTVGIKTIGVGYNMKNADARAAFKAIGADYDKFYNGPVTPATKKCDCSAVPCLTEEQIDELFDRSVKIAIADAQKVISTFSTLCCPVQDVMVDMAFTLGGKGFSQFTTFAKLVTLEYWKAAGDDLTVSKWCVHDAPRRCLSDSATVAKGCGCSGLYTQACDVQASSCCSSVQTCCKGGLDILSNILTAYYHIETSVLLENVFACKICMKLNLNTSQ